MHVIWHDYKGIESRVAEMSRDILPCMGNHGGSFRILE